MVVKNASTSPRVTRSKKALSQVLQTIDDVTRKGHDCVGRGKEDVQIETSIEVFALATKDDSHADKCKCVSHGIKDKIEEGFDIRSRRTNERE
jgi:hypothetical protein